MVASRCRLVFAGAAFVAGGTVPNDWDSVVCAPITVQHAAVFNTRRATVVKLSGRIVAWQDVNSFEISDLFREQTKLEHYRAYIVVIGIAALLAQSALILLLMVGKWKRRHLDQTVRSLTRRHIDTGEEESRHLARELHDDIGQRLSLISMELDSVNLERIAGHKDGDLTFARALEELRTVISDVHNLSHRLHSSRLEHLGLQDALKELCEQIALRHELQLDLQMDEIGGSLDRDVTLCFYRVAQEALSNVARHSSSSRATVRLIVSNGILKLQVIDDGAGFDSSKTLSGLGMVTMEERLRILGGKLSVTSKPGEGTVVTAQASLSRLKHPKSRGAKGRSKSANRQEALTDKRV